MNPVVCLNHQWVPQDQASISVMDRGFLFGDGVYEVVSVFDRSPFLMHEHFDRLQTSLNGIRINNPLTVDEWSAITIDIIKRNNITNGYVYLQITRGSPKQRSHRCPKNTPPNWLVMSQNIAHHKEYVRAHLVPDQRWGQCAIKATSLLANVLATMSAHDCDADEAILFNDHAVTEGASSNVFIIENNKVITTPLSDNILPGIIRQYIITVMQSLMIPFEETRISINRLKQADICFITSSTRLIKCVSHLDQQPMNTEHPILTQLFRTIQHDISTIASTHPA